MLQVKNMRKDYGNKQVIRSVDLTIEKGEIFGFIGRNGAGKSTFINMLTGVIHPTAGEINFFGQGPLTTKLKQRIGILPDYSTFYDHLNAIDHLRYFAQISGTKITKAKGFALLEKVGLQNAATTKLSKYSFGMKKKLGIAQALVHDPEFLFLDEPTSGVDAESAIYLQALLRDLQSKGKTIFLTSHNLYEIEKLCDRIAILKDGQIAKMGTIDELRAKERQAITVHIKHAKLPESNAISFQNGCTVFGEILKMKEKQLKIQVQEEQQIAHVLRVFHQLKIDVYRVEVDEKTLEDIFIGEE